jgi:hypothetical protein
MSTDARFMTSFPTGLPLITSEVLRQRSAHLAEGSLEYLRQLLDERDRSEWPIQPVLTNSGQTYPMLHFHDTGLVLKVVCSRVMYVCPRSQVFAQPPPCPHPMVWSDSLGKGFPNVIKDFNKNSLLQGHSSPEQL